MEYLNREDTFTVSEALQSVGCGLEIPDGYVVVEIQGGRPFLKIAFSV